MELGQVAWEWIALSASNVAAAVAQYERFGGGDARVVSDALGGAARMEPRVISMLLFGWRRGPEEAEAEEADMVLPRASVVVRSHCFASTVLGRMGGLLAALEP